VTFQRHRANSTLFDRTTNSSKSAVSMTGYSLRLPNLSGKVLLADMHPA
jgi:hypothetical protein